MKCLKSLVSPFYRQNIKHQEIEANLQWTIMQSLFTDHLPKTPYLRVSNRHPQKDKGLTPAKNCRLPLTSFPRLKLELAIQIFFRRRGFGISLPSGLCPPNLAIWSITVSAEHVITNGSIARLAGFRQHDQEGVKKQAN